MVRFAHTFFDKHREEAEFVCPDATWKAFHLPARITVEDAEEVEEILNKACDFISKPSCSRLFANIEVNATEQF